MNTLLRHTDKRKKIVFAVIGILLLIGAIAVLVRQTSSSNASSTATPSISNNTTTKSIDINREFLFPIKNGESEEVGHIKFVIEKAELLEKIVVQGKTATAVSGRIFLIVTAKLTNDLDKNIQINTRDYVRLMRNGNSQELLAPEIHNDPVEVLAISTKYTRVGFSIGSTDKDLNLLIGEIKGEKQTIPLSL
ncbi:hypothetical protein HY468_04000 [Candidatus Roizmanbacteria bacterium]|nr:hypothetical protein [Candidatus Roizmanbacteria bacterium]